MAWASLPAQREAVAAHPGTRTVGVVEMPTVVEGRIVGVLEKKQPVRIHAEGTGAHRPGTSRHDGFGDADLAVVYDDKIVAAPPASCRRGRIL